MPPSELEKAAADLAATLVAARRQKQATLAEDLGALVRSPGVRSALTGTAIGAGIGGLGGLAMGASDRRRGSPLSTALTGAVAGGAAGLGGGILHGMAANRAVSAPELADTAQLEAGDTVPGRVKGGLKAGLKGLMTGAYSTTGDVYSGYPRTALGATIGAGTGVYSNIQANRAGALEKAVQLHAKDPTSVIVPGGAMEAAKDVVAAGRVAETAARSRFSNLIPGRANKARLAAETASAAELIPDQASKARLAAEAASTAQHIPGARPVTYAPRIDPKSLAAARAAGRAKMPWGGKRIGAYAGLGGLAANLIPEGLHYVADLYRGE